MAKYNHIYRSVNIIKDPSLRALCFAIVEDNWESFYTKKIVGLSMSTSGKIGWELVEEQLKSAEEFKHVFRETTVNWDVIHFLAYVYPAYIGKSLSPTKVEGWDELIMTHMWRDPEYKSYIHPWREYVSEKLKEFPVSKKLKGLIIDILEDRRRDTMEYMFWYQIYSLMKGSLTLIKKG